MSTAPMQSHMQKLLRHLCVTGGKSLFSGRLPVLAVFLLLSLSALANAAAPAPLPRPHGKVAKCFDGDTIKLTDRRIVRLAGIDSPEMDHGKKKPQYYAREAMEHLAHLTHGKEVRLVAVDAQGKDRYGRIVADVTLPDGR